MSIDYMTTQELAKAIQTPSRFPWVILGDAFWGLFLLGMVFAWVDIITFY